ncbi:MAG: lincosamide nucleotidyltransferase [Rubrobacteraceae bacterium]|nr:lincosamide nucleotidyltransferase [Rubrobacteraceae bacterium]
MLQQEAMIKQVRQLCYLDERLVAAMMYGSFAQSEGDEFSDIEFILFFDDDVLEGLDQREWVDQLAPVELYFVNEFGVGTAIFDNLIRGEFHFGKASDIEKIDDSWKRTDWLPSLDTALLLDRTGELSHRLQMIVGPPLDRDTLEQTRFLCDSYVNWLLFGSNLLARGELARSLDFLGFVQRYLLWMARLLEHTTTHWPTPSKALEKDISEAAYARYTACTANLDKEALHSAYLSAWAWGREMMLSLAERHNVVLPWTFYGRLDQRLTDIYQRLR